MKQHFWHSGKFWLKLATAVITVCAVLTLTVSIMLYVLFSPERIRQYADHAVVGTGRHIRYDAEVDRSWFPRPTITLHHVAVSRPHSDAAFFYAEEMRIGMAWKSLLGAAEIEKWVWIRPEIQLTRQSATQWNIEDLLHTPSSGSINRLIIENGSFHIDTDLTYYRLTDVNLTVRGFSSDTPQFEANGKLPNPWLSETAWQLKGSLQPQGGNRKITALNLSGSGVFRNQPLTFQAASGGIWIAETDQLKLNNVDIKIDTNWNQAHCNLTLPQLTFGYHVITAPQSNAVLTAQYRNRQWDASVHTDSVKIYPALISAEKIGIDGNWKGSSEQGSFTLDTDADWQSQRGLSLSPLKFTTRIDTLKGEPRPHFVGDWEGWLKWQSENGWQTKLGGTFDRQPANIELNYTPRTAHDTAKLTALVRTDKLNLMPYWHYFQTDSATFPYPQLLQQSNAPQISAEFTAGSLQLPDLTLDDVHTHITADSKRIVLPDFHAALYGGQTEGEIGIANTQPASYHIQQYAKNIQVRPLMQDLLNYGNIGGQGDVIFNLATKGNNRQAWLSELNGTLDLTLRNGVWVGIDLNNLLKNPTAASDSTPATPFNRFTVHSVIEKGISRHQNAELVSDTLTVHANGSTDFNTQIMDENLLVRAKGMTDKPIPLKIRGPITNPSVTVDYPKLTKGLNTPEEKQKALTNALKEQWLWLNRPEKH